MNVGRVYLKMLEDFVSMRVLFFGVISVNVLIATKQCSAIFSASASDKQTYYDCGSCRDGKGKARVPVLSSVCEQSVRPGHLGIHYRRHDSIILGIYYCPMWEQVLVVSLGFVLISCAADSQVSDMTAAK